MGKKYSIIYADPPWKYKYSGENIKTTAEGQYKCMNIDDICSLPIEQIAAKDCVLFLWVTFPFLKEGLETIRRWGFNYRTCAFNWVKRNKKADSWFFGLGFWTRTNSEVCLLATRGHPKRKSKFVPQICDARLMEHSRKPAEIRDRIVELCGDLPRIELFARQETEGWDCLGNEIDGRDIRDCLSEIIEEKTEE